MRSERDEKKVASDDAPSKCRHGQIARAVVLGTDNAIAFYFHITCTCTCTLTDFHIHNTCTHEQCIIHCIYTVHIHIHVLNER